MQRNSKSDNDLDALVDFLCEADPEITRAQALNWLAHSRSGRALVQRFSKHGKAIFKQKEPVMTRTENLAAIAKDYGVARFAKFVIDEGASGITEHELCKMFTDAIERRSGESAAQAFSRAFCANDEAGNLMRKAVAVVKNYPQVMSIEPTYGGGKDATDVNDGEAAYGKLMALAEEQRKRSPTLTISQAFAQVAAETKNAQLLADAVLRSRARTSSITGAIVG